LLHLVVWPEPISTSRAGEFSPAGSRPRQRRNGVTALDYAANPRVVEEADMHILEAALICNLRIGAQEKAIARSDSLRNGLSSVMRLAAAVVAIGLVVVSLNSASTGAAREAAATTARATEP
jgi:hypothetical protein